MRLFILHLKPGKKPLKESWIAHEITLVDGELKATNKDGVPIVHREKDQWSSISIYKGN